MKDKAKLIKQFHTLCSVAKLSKQHKQDIVHTHTDGMHTSSAYMTEAQLEQAIEYIKSISSDIKKERDTADVLRKRIIGIYREMGKVTFDSNRDKMVADMNAINEALKAKWHKSINEYTIPELSRIIAVLNTNILPAYYKKKLHE